MSLRKFFPSLLVTGTIFNAAHLHADAFKAYLSGHSIYAMVYDSNRKLLWLGSYQHGLISFDGHTFKYYTPPSSQASAQLYIQALELDGQGRLWIGTANLGVFHFEPTSNTWHSPYNVSNGLPQNYVLSLEIDNFGRLWVGTQNNGVGLFQPDSGKWYRYTTAEFAEWTGASWNVLKVYTAGEPHLVNNKVHSIAVDERGNLWFGTDLGASVLNHSGAWDMTYWPGITVPSIFVDRAQNKWFGTIGGVYTLTENDSMKRQPEDTPNCIRKRILAVASTGDDLFWFGNNDGATQLDTKHMIWRCTTGSVVDGKRVKSITATEDGVIWFGLDNEAGVVRYLSNWTNYSTANDDSLRAVFEDTDGNKIRAIVQDPQNRIWIATLRGVAYHENGQFHPKNFFTPVENLANEITAIAIAADNTLWLGSYSGGVLHYFKSDDSFIQHPVPRSGPESNSNLVLVLTLQGDILWVGTEEGLHRYDTQNRTWQSYTAAEGLSHNRIQALAIDFDNVLWIGAATGVCRYDGQISCLSDGPATEALGVNGVNSITIDAGRRRIWFGTAGNGAAYYENGSWNRYTIFDGLVDNNVQDIQVLHVGDKYNTWFATSNGLSILDSTNQWINYTAIDGLPDENVTALLLRTQDEYWIGTQGGGVTRVRRQQEPPETTIATPVDITFQPEVLFRFYGLDKNTAADRLRYAHRLDNQPWQYTVETIARVPLTADGMHTFHVKAIDKDGNEDPHPARNTFYKRSHNLGSKSTLTDSVGFKGLKPITIALTIPPNTFPEGSTFAITHASEDSLAETDLFAYRISLIASSTVNAFKPVTLAFSFPAQGSSPRPALAIYNENSRLGGTVLPAKGGMASISTPIQSLGTFSVRDETNLPIPSDRPQQTAQVNAQPRIFSPAGGGHGAETTLSFYLDREAQVRVCVFNLSGRLVKTIFEGIMNRGLQAVAWNGYDRDNRLCTTGLYIMTIESDVLNDQKSVMVLNDH